MTRSATWAAATSRPADVGSATTAALWRLFAGISLAVAVGIMAVFSVAVPAVAQEVCVECSGPDARYRCSIRDFAKVSKYRSTGKVLELVCITELARTGRHASCRAGNSFSGPCIGPTVQLDPERIGTLPPEPKPGLEPALQSGSTPELKSGSHQQAPGANPATPGMAPPRKNEGSKPPQTLEEMARNSKLDMSGVKEGVQKAGKAVGGAVNSSWRCISSLFTRC